MCIQCKNSSKKISPALQNSIRKKAPRKHRIDPNLMKTVCKVCQTEFGEADIENLMVLNKKPVKVRDGRCGCGRPIKNAWFYKHLRTGHMILLGVTCKKHLMDEQRNQVRSASRISKISHQNEERIYITDIVAYSKENEQKFILYQEEELLKIKQENQCVTVERNLSKLHQDLKTLIEHFGIDCLEGVRRSTQAYLNHLQESKTTIEQVLRNQKQKRREENERIKKEADIKQKMKDTIEEIWTNAEHKEADIKRNAEHETRKVWVQASDFVGLAEREAYIQIQALRIGKKVY